MKKLALIISLGCLAGVLTVGCSGGNGAEDSGLSGAIVVDGSSTVGPISAAVAEEFGIEHGKTQPTVAESGTGGGFKKFCNDEIDITGASRPIKQSEIEACQAAGVEFIELPVAFDGISVVLNPENAWAENLTVEELKKIWEPNSGVDSWDDVRGGFPSEKITLYGPGTDSGTFDYFTDVIVGEEGASRTDYQASEDDNVLVQGVAGDKGALGYFGYAYYDQNRDKLRAAKVEGVEPTAETIESGEYAPLSRPIFIYVNKTALEKPQVAAFVDYYLTESSELIEQVGYVPLPEATIDLVKQRVENKIAGSLFSTAPTDMTVAEVLQQKPAAEAENKE